MNTHLFGWPGSSLVFAVLALVLRPSNRWSVAYLGSFASLAFAYVFYFYQDLCFGPRFLYEASSALLILTASGVVATAVAVRASARFASRPGAGCALAGAALASLYLGSAVSYLPGRVAEFRFGYWIVENDFLERLEAKGLDNSLVFITSEYRNVSFLNPQHPEASVIYVRSLGERNNRRLMDHYPDRVVYLEEDGELRTLRAGGGLADRILER